MQQTRVSWIKIIFGALFWIILLIISDSACENKIVKLENAVKVIKGNKEIKHNKNVIQTQKVSETDKPLVPPKNFKILNNEAATISVTAQGISEVINEFLIKKSLRFDLIICGKSTNHLNYVTNKVLSKISEQTATQIFRFAVINDCFKKKIDKSAVFFVEDSKTVKSFNGYNQNLLLDFFDLPADCRIFFYVENDASGVSDLDTPKLTDLNLYSMPIYAFEFLLLNEKSELKLKSVSYFAEGKCEEAKILELNSMSKISGKWEKNLENYEHLSNFHGCLIKLINLCSPAFYAEEFKHLMRNRIEYENNAPKIRQIIKKGHLTLRGIFYETIKAIAKHANFTVYHQMWIPTMSGENGLVPQNGKIINTKLSLECFVLTPDVFLKNKLMHSIRAPLSSTEYYYLVTPNDFYTNYEKLFFAFDTYTWVCFGLSFGFTFGVIFTVNRLQQRVKDVIFGRGIKNQTYNALSIFFGISQTKLPSENFARILVAMFLFLCLIFRTCYQSKMFEFMTTDMRKPLPETIEDLYSMKYTVVFEHQHSGFHDEIVANRTG
jgi:hypothetical protein